MDFFFWYGFSFLLKITGLQVGWFNFLFCKIYNIIRNPSLENSWTCLWKIRADCMDLNLFLLYRLNICFFLMLIQFKWQSMKFCLFRFVIKVLYPEHLWRNFRSLKRVVHELSFQIIKNKQCADLFNLSIFILLLLVIQAND